MPDNPVAFDPYRIYKPAVARLMRELDAAVMRCAAKDAEINRLREGMKRLIEQAEVICPECAAVITFSMKGATDE